MSVCLGAPVLDSLQEQIDTLFKSAGDANPDMTIRSMGGKRDVVVEVDNNNVIWYPCIDWYPELIEKE